MTNKPDSCKQCPFYEHRFVPSEGDSNAMIALIGEAPGNEETAIGRPFVGTSGKMLDKLLFAAGLNRDQCRLMNVLKCQPPSNDIHTPDARKAIKCCSSIFISEVQQLKSRVIIPLGNTALNALGYNYKINEVRGTYFSLNGIPIVPTLHPAAVLRQFEDWILVQSDFKKAARVALTGVVPTIEEHFHTQPTILDVEAFCGDICDSADRATEMVNVSYDLETFITDHELRTPIKLIGIGKDKREAMSIPFITQSGNLYWPTRNEGARAMAAVYRVLTHPRLRKLGQNLLFDFRISMNHGLDVIGPVWDSMIAHFLIYHPIAHDLQTIASIYTDFPPWKTLKGMDDIEYRKYNCRDNIVLHNMFPKMSEELVSNRVQWVFAHVMDTLIPYCQMSLNGLPIDRSAQEEVAKKLLAEEHALTKELMNISGALTLNPKSTPQLREILFKQMKMQSRVMTKGGKTGKKVLSVDKSVLNKLSLRYPDNLFLTKLLEYNSVEQLHSTYAQPDIFLDGRIHTHFKLAVITGRPSSTNPNVLNLPSKNRGDERGYIKSMYVAPPGKVFIEADWSQAELVIFADISGDEEWQLCFKNGDDVHKLNGIALIGEYVEKYRTFFKNFIYGFVYGSEGDGIKKVAPKELIMRLSVEDMIESFKTRHPRMFLYREDLERQITQTHRIRNPFGRARFFVGNPTKENLREAYNFPIQSTVADMMNVKIGIFSREFNLREKELLMPLYDALYWLTDERDLDSFVPVMKSIMESPVETPDGQVFKLKADVKVGKKLNELVKWKGTAV
jgi:uracil-DNA glycosylase family 4